MMLLRENFELLGLAVVIVGLPALILKVAAIWFVRSESDKPRLRLLGFSVGGASLAGIATIAAYVALSHALEFPAPAEFRPEPMVMISAIAILVTLVAAFELVLWHDFTQGNGTQAKQTDAAWLIAGNIWILWAIWLMDQYREIQQLSTLN
jgi:hypothetical protein